MGQILPNGSKARAASRSFSTNGISPPGADRTHFMEQGVANSDFVVVICTPGYAERANNREGGVGYESMVITGMLAESILDKKFIPVLRGGTWKESDAYLPQAEGRRGFEQNALLRI